MYNRQTPQEARCHYGYVRQVMVFYIILYVLKRWISQKLVLTWMAALFLPLAWLFGVDFRTRGIERLVLGGLWRVFFLQVMLLGSYLALRTSRERQEKRGERASISEGVSEHS